MNYTNTISHERGRNANYNNFMNALKRNLGITIEAARPSRTREYAKRWRETLPYEVRQGRVNVKLPANVSDIISYKILKG